MNSDNQNLSCCGRTRESPRTQNTCNIPYYDPPIVPQLVCGPKACSIFGTHDYYPASVTCAPRKKRRENLNTLGAPIGLVMSSVGVKGADSLQQRYATYLKAFARIYITPESEWNVAVLDQLMKEGQQLLAESQRIDASVEVFSPIEIYSEVEAKVKRNFQLAGCTFSLELSDKYRVNTKTDVEKNGDEPTPDLSQEVLRAALKGFFRVGKYCFLRIGGLYLMIWKSRGVFFVFDCNGRRPTDFITDREKGFAMLICLKSLENVRHLVKNLSDLKKEDTFSLRELKVVKLVGVDGKAMNREFGKRTNQYEILTPDFAFLKAQLHLSLNKADPLRNRSALPVAVATLLASKIDHPATWNQKMLDKIICYGVNVCKTGWAQCRNREEPIQVELFPTQLKIGQFIAGYLITGPTHEGTWKCVPNYTNTDLTKALERSFEGYGKNLLVQFDNQFYAIWMKNNFIYFMDPYRHRVPHPIGDVADNKKAALRMFRSIDVFIKMFNQLLLETNRTSSFYIYRLQVKKLSLVEKAECVPEDEVPLQEDEEVKSLNETICFEEDETVCTAELLEISDYEEEDTISDLIRLDIKEPKSETDESEEGMEEEEMGMEDLGEYESSSSGDGGHGHARRKKMTKGKKKSERGKQLQKSKKGKTGKKGTTNVKEKKKKGMKDKKGKKDKKLKERKDKKVKEKKEKKGKKDKKDKKVKEKKVKEKKENKGVKGKKENKGVKGKEKKGKEKKETAPKEKKETKGKKEQKGKKDKKQNEDTGKEKKETGKKDTKKKKKGEDQSDDEDPSKKGTNKDKKKNKKKGADESDDEDPSKKKAKKDKKKGDESDTDNEKPGKKRKKTGKGEEETDSDGGRAKPKKKRTSKGGDSDDKEQKDKGLSDKSDRSDKTSKSDKDSMDDKSIKDGKDRKGVIDRTDKDIAGSKYKKEQYGSAGRYGPSREISRDHQARTEDSGDEDEASKRLIGCKPNNYPGYSTVPHDMAVVGSESGSYESICKLLRAGFKCADRILTMTPWGNYVVFRGHDAFKKIYFLFDGCTCNINRFRHLDLNCGTAGLLCFKNLHDVICYILDSHKIRTNLKKSRKNIVDEICKQYCN